ncbi:MAG: hypothetical protein R3C03_10775 [Pirellulaceae bacterium]
MSSYAIATRFIWKEFRSVVPVIVLTTLFIVGALVQDFLFNSVEFSKTEGALVFAAGLLGIASAIIIFAMEVEGQTTRFMSLLPISPWRVMLGKWLIGMVLLVAGILALSLVVRIGLPAVDQSYFDRNSKNLPTISLPLAFVVGLQLYCLGTIFSCLRFNIPLVIFCSTAAFNLYNATLSRWIVDETELNSTYGVIVNFIWANAAVVAVSLAVSLVYGTPFINVYQHTLADSRQSAIDRIWAHPFWSKWNFNGFVVLTWQTVRQSWPIMLLCGVSMIAVGMVIRESIVRVEESLWFWVLMMIPCLAGALIFWRDQERSQHQFFFQHRVSGPIVWIARVIPWVLFVGICLVIVQSLVQAKYTWFLEDWLRRYWQNNNQYFQSAVASREQAIIFNIVDHPLQAFYLALLMLGIGQLCSLVFRNVMLAVGSALFIGMAGAWYWYLVTYLAEPAVMFVLPLAIVVFLVGAWYSRHWIRGSVTWRKVATVWVALPLALCFQIAALWSSRAYEFEDLGTSFSYQRPKINPSIVNKLKSHGEPIHYLLEQSAEDLRKALEIEDADISKPMLETMSREKMISEIDDWYRGSDSAAEYRSMMLYYLVIARIQAEVETVQKSTEAYDYAMECDLALPFVDLNTELLGRERLNFDLMYWQSLDKGMLGNDEYSHTLFSSGAIY